MTREQAKKLLPAITHFAKGGNLWCVDTLGQWKKQCVVAISNLASQNVIEDKHFEARKAYALGGEVMYFIHFEGKQQWVVVTDSSDLWCDGVLYNPVENDQWVKLDATKRFRK